MNYILKVLLMIQPSDESVAPCKSRIIHLNGAICEVFEAFCESFPNLKKKGNLFFWLERLIRDRRMEIVELDKRPNIGPREKLIFAYAQFEKLLAELRKRELPEEIVKVVNDGVGDINSVLEPDLRKQLRKTQSRILKLIEQELKLVTMNHYRKTWSALGMTAFGIPLGVAFGASVGNLGLLGIGLPIGLAIGMAVGAQMDRKAFESGRQLDLDVRY